MIVATARALRHHGGVAKEQLTAADAEAVRRGLPNLEQHIHIVTSHGVPPVVAVNRFDEDTDEEFQIIADRCAELGVPCVSTEVWAEGAEGGLELADAVKQILAGGQAKFQHLYPVDVPIKEKVDTIATRVYGADHVEWAPAAVKQRNELERLGFGTSVRRR